ncbi:fimbrial protein [Lascolabacillus massiliensis]|uniref:fimbrial protein n=1 Tax=Lascolabacillus massiliensis TaxID=1627894 RepID=UPI0006B3642E|nr:fimbrial protein [Lascolabacillus massiliensis]
MKIFKVLLVVAIALGMMACNNEQDVPEIIDGPEATVSVRVVPTSNGPSVRLAGDITSTLAAESVIKTLEVFIFSGGMPDGYGTATADDVTQVIGIETHSGPKTFYVVANANIGKVDSEVDLLAKTKELPVVIDNGLPMTSDRKEVVLVAGENQYGFTSGSDNYKVSANNLSETPVALVRVNARVAIVSAALSNNLPADQQAIFDDLTDIEVAMFNVPKASNLFGESLEINENFLFGEAWPTTQNTYTVGVENDNFKKTELSFPISNTYAPYFYVTENTSTEDNQRMFIVLRGKPTKGGNPVVAEGLYTDVEGYTYYPIWVNANDKGYDYGNEYAATNVISRNTQYNISLTINGIGNPTIDEVEEAFLDVNVSVAPWAVVTQNVEW